MCPSWAAVGDLCPWALARSQPLSVLPLQDNALVGDAFMRKIEAVAAFVPYMTCPGNHEEK